jgi:hypothetical protein
VEQRIQKTECIAQIEMRKSNSGCDDTYADVKKVLDVKSICGKINDPLRKVRHNVHTYIYACSLIFNLFDCFDIVSICYVHLFVNTRNYKFYLNA